MGNRPSSRRPGLTIETSTTESIATDSYVSAMPPARLRALDPTAIVTTKSLRPNMDAATLDGKTSIVLKRYGVGRSKHLAHEASILSRLESPFVVAAVGSLGASTLAIEYMDQGNLVTFLEGIGHPLSLLWPARAYIAYCITAGVAYLHAQNVSHRRLHTKRVLLNSNMDVKLCGLFDTSDASPINMGLDMCALGTIFLELAAFAPREAHPKNASSINHAESTKAPDWFYALAYQCTEDSPMARPMANDVLAILAAHGANTPLLYDNLHDHVPVRVTKYMPINPVETAVIDVDAIAARLRDLPPWTPVVVPPQDLPRLDPSMLHVESKQVVTTVSVAEFRGTYDEEPVAVYRLHKLVTATEHALLLDHVGLRAGLQASCVEPLLGVCDDAHGLPCMVLRRSAVPRLPLQELLSATRPQTGAFLWRHKLALASAVAKGLAELHAARVLVPNLSSRNVLVPGDGLVTGDFADIKLIDVGVALAQRAAETLTLGTGGCRSLAPEVLRATGLETSYSDVYAFGVLLLELNTHQIPFYEIKRDTEARSAIASGRQPRFTSDCPFWYKDLALACMHMDPFARPSLEDVAASLEAHLEGTGLDPLLDRVDLVALDATQLTVGRNIGSGIFSNAYTATYASRSVIVKRPNQYRQNGEHDQPATFLHEITLLARLRCQHIMPLLGVAHINLAQPSMVLEVMDAGSVRSYMTQFRDPSAFPDDTRLHIALGAAQAIEYLHEVRVVHCDLKSDNIYVTSKRHVKLGMLALAKHLNKRTNAATSATIAGTLLWMAPEIIHGALYTTACDVYSFGVVLTELDTLQRPFADTQLGRYALPQKIAAGDVTPSLRPACAEWYQHLARDCMAFEPHLRPTMSEVVEQLRQQVALDPKFGPEIVAPDATATGASVLDPAPLLASLPLVDAADIVVDECVLGSGAYGTVSWGHYKSSPVAIKQLHANNLRDDAKLRKFMRELELHTRFTSPHIVACIGVCDVGPMLLMEYMEKGDLRRHLDGLLYIPNPVEVLPWSTRCDMALSLAQAIALLHAHGVVHRDIKSPNLLLNANLRLKLGDFGEAHAVAEDALDDVMDDIGTVLWMAPELFDCSGLRDTTKTDIYSFGVVLTELATLQKPYAAMALHPYAIQCRVALGDLRPNVGDHAPSWFQALAASCLQFEADLRPTASSIAERLRHRMRDTCMLPDAPCGDLVLRE